MVKIALQIKAELQNVDELETNHPEYNFILKIKCLNCGETSDKWHDVTESQTYPTKMGKTEANYLAKCKLCQRENSMDILPGTNGKFTSATRGQFTTIVTFDCRGLEPVDFQPADGWIARVAESGKEFGDIDLSEKEWVEYNDDAKEWCGISEFEHQFIKVK